MSRAVESAGIVLLVLVALGLVADAMGDAARAEAEVVEAERRAAVAEDRATRAWEAYTAHADTVTMLADSLGRVRERASITATRVRVRVDTLERQVPDTGAVPRPLHDSIVGAWKEIAGAEAARADAAEAEATLWRQRTTVAEAGWTMEREANAALRVALDRYRERGGMPGWQKAALTVAGGVAGWKLVVKPLIEDG